MTSLLWDIICCQFIITTTNVVCNLLHDAVIGRGSFKCLFKAHQQMPRRFPLENWRPPGRPRTAWMKTIQQDLKSNNLSLNEAIDVA